VGVGWRSPTHGYFCLRPLSPYILRAPAPRSLFLSVQDLQPRNVQSGVGFVGSAASVRGYDGALPVRGHCLFGACPQAHGYIPPTKRMTLPRPSHQTKNTNTQATGYDGGCVGGGGGACARACVCCASKWEVASVVRTDHDTTQQPCCGGFFTGFGGTFTRLLRMVRAFKKSRFGGPPRPSSSLTSRSVSTTSE
jgi:hypothetical protein